jgi:tetratricopeptide (TPR) repeat protein
VSAAAIALVLFLQPAASSTSAYGTARPAECGLSDGFKAANPWERAKEPNLRRYCDLLASGTAKLVGTGSTTLLKEVPGIADEADKLLPGRASPAVLKGRAYLRMGQPGDALKALEDAKKRDDRALDDPVALLAWARANARTGHLAEAATAYRAALPRTSALTAQERSAAAFEAGMTVMMQGPKAIDDAVAMFRQARLLSQDSLQVASVVALALALDRAGQKDEAKALLAERIRTDARPFIVGDSHVRDALADAGVPDEQDALLGLALEGQDVAGAKDAWRKYLDGPGGKGPWADHARDHAGPAVTKPAPKPAATRTR